MTTQLDASVGFKKEATWGTAVTVDRWLEFTKHSFIQDTKYEQGQGLRVGKRADRLQRRVSGAIDAKGDFSFEATPAGIGTMLELMLGSATSTLRSGSTYQQNFTPATTDPMPAATFQVGIPPLGGGAALPHTFSGMVCDKWSLSMDANKPIVEFNTSWVGKDMVTATAYAAPSYSAQVPLYTFNQGAVTLGAPGTFTAPTNTALATITAGTTPGDITKFSLNYSNDLDVGGRVLGSAGKRGRRPALGGLDITGSFTTELTSATWRDYYLNQTWLSLLITLTGPVYTTVTPALSIAMPCLQLESGVPCPDAGKVVTTDIKFKVMDPDNGSFPIYISNVTADTAL